MSPSSARAVEPDRRVRRDVQILDARVARLGVPVGAVVDHAACDRQRRRPRRPSGSPAPPRPAASALPPVATPARASGSARAHPHATAARARRSRRATDRSAAAPAPATEKSTSSSRTRATSSPSGSRSSTPPRRRRLVPKRNRSIARRPAIAPSICPTATPPQGLAAPRRVQEEHGSAHQQRQRGDHHARRPAPTVRSRRRIRTPLRSRCAARTGCRARPW